ncbi:MAG TPA: hypothetical protein VGM03_08320 [Phycisphaerae bacterium]
MLYAALTFWLLITVLTAWGVHALWSGMCKPRVVNSVLLPGTLVAQLGHVLGLLVTGATVSNTALVADDESGAPQHTTDAKPRIPILGPVIIGMLPLLACAAAMLVVAHWLGGSLALSGGSIAPAARVHSVARSLPTSLPAFWQMLRDHVTVVEELVAGVTSSDLTRWQAWVFVYLTICLTVRMAPFPGTLRGCLGAIVVLGLLAALGGALVPATAPWVARGWPVLNLAVATASFLLLASLLVRGLIGLAKLLASNS